VFVWRWEFRLPIYWNSPTSEQSLGKIYLLMEVALRQAGGKVVRTAVGDRYVVEEMLRHGYRVAGEQSGHMIFLDHNTTGDGMISALQVLAIIQRSGKSLSELARVMTALPQVLVNVRIKQRQDLAEVPMVAGAIKAAEEALGNDGRVLIRYSGTEPLLRIMLEGQDQPQITALAHEIARSIEIHMGGTQEG
jgi:phosphoglucosamine mutase